MHPSSAKRNLLVSLFPLPHFPTKAQPPHFQLHPPLAKAQKPTKEAAQLMKAVKKYLESTKVCAHWLNHISSHHKSKFLLKPLL